MSLPSINFLHLTVSEIQPGQTFSRRPDARLPAHPDTMGENNTPTALKGCGVKMFENVDLRIIFCVRTVICNARVRSVAACCGSVVTCQGSEKIPRPLQKNPTV